LKSGELFLASGQKSLSLTPAVPMQKNWDNINYYAEKLLRTMHAEKVANHNILAGKLLSGHQCLKGKHCRRAKNGSPGFAKVSE
jgi:hypothetical protein